METARADSAGPGIPPCPPVSLSIAGASLLSPPWDRDGSREERTRRESREKQEG